MTQISRETATSLGNALTGYGDMAVAVRVVDDQDAESAPLYDLRLEINVDRDGRRYIAITAYEPKPDDQRLKDWDGEGMSITPVREKPKV